RIAEDQFEGRNAGSSLHQGIEWEGQYTLKINNIQKVFFSTSITFNDFRFTDFLDLDIRHDGNALPAVPNWQTASRVVWQINPDWDFSLIYRYIGKMPLNDANS
ncbi:hypothetical protein RZS08_50675, partial [Arthrospira platensis SPKY1]|nr:hypothetical protein [Arthrospira platensis SPKY1]